MAQTQRDEIEKKLLENFEYIKPLEISDIETINRFKDSSFGLSYLGFLLYSNGHSLRGKSSKYTNGLLYNDGKNIFSIGFFKKTLKKQNGHLFIVAPHGKNWINAINVFIRKVRELKISLGSIYIRHLSEIDFKQIVKQDGYFPIATDPWHPSAPMEDETYEHRLIDLNNFFDKKHREHHHLKMANQRFKNFLSRNQLQLNIARYDSSKNRTDAKYIIDNFFKILEEKQKNILSTPEDYLNFIEIPMNNIFYPYMGYLHGDNINMPIMLFIGEKIGTNMIGLYSTLALRDKNILPEWIDLKAYTAISQYCYWKIFNFIHQKNIRYIDMGGSETIELDLFKKQLGASKMETYWVVNKFS